MSEYTPVSVKVWGPWACFTRPEMKVERVSYDVMTPSAARGILEAIFWKPEIMWQIQQIKVLHPIRHFSILRTEVNSKAAVKSAKKWAEEGGNYIANDDHTQRHTLALRDVAYVIEADVHLTERGKGSHPAKYRDQFRRRVAKGQCYQRPYLGCREFPAAFAEPDGTETPIKRTDDLGRMLFDLDYTAKKQNTPVFFSARLEDGVLHVPQHLYDHF